MKARELIMPRRIVCLCLLGAAVAASLAFLIAEVRMLLVPAQFDYGEGHVLWMAQQITNAGSSYTPNDHLPYIVFPYPPLYLLAARAVNVVIGDLLVAGRSLSLACSMGIAVVVALTVFLCAPARFPRIWRWAGAAYAAALVLCMESVAGWGSLMRVDMLALFLMFAGLAVYIIPGRRERWQYVAALLFVLAVFTKQTMFSVPLACAIFGLVKNPRSALRVYGFAIVLGLCGLFFCNSITHGGFWKNIVHYNLSPFSWKTALWQTSSHLRACLPSAAVAAAALLCFWNARAVRRFGWKRFLRIRSGRIYDRAIIICGLNWLLAGIWTLSIGKMGSSYNFFLALDISTCFLCGLFLFRFLATWSANNQDHKTVSLALVLLFLLMLLPPGNVMAGFMDHTSLVEEEAQLVRLIRASPGPVMSENLLVMTKAGKEMQIEPSTVTFLARAGRWDERPFLRLLDQQYFKLIVIWNHQGFSNFTAAMISSIERAYSLDQTIGRYSIYRPRPSR